MIRLMPWSILERRLNHTRIADIAFNPKEACRAIQQLLEIRSILKSHNIGSKIELNALLAYAAREDV